MRRRLLLAASALSALCACAAFVAPASALTMKECSARYKAARDGGSAKGMKWTDFRKAECGAKAAARPKAPGDSGGGKPVKATVKVSADVTFPKGIAARYAGETPGKGRLHTCSDAYRANKQANTLGGLRWIQKGGGYYSLCSARLKASS